MTEKIKGRCYCGQIEYEAGLPSHWSGHCHCRQCQVLHGAAFVTWVGFRSSLCQIHDPQHVLKIYNTGRADRGSCSACGSWLYFQYMDKPESTDYIFFTRTSFVTPLPDKPVEHIYYASHAEWFDVNDNLPQRDD